MALCLSVCSCTSLMIQLSFHEISGMPAWLRLEIDPAARWVWLQ
jgi:hypothetical protein